MKAAKSGTNGVKASRVHKNKAKGTDADADHDVEQYVLRLYVTGATPKSTRAITNIKAICDEHLEGHYTLEVIDVYQQPELAQQEDIVAMPTLVKQLPTPLRRLVGDLRRRESPLGVELAPQVTSTIVVLTRLLTGIVRWI